MIRKMKRAGAFLALLAIGAVFIGPTIAQAQQFWNGVLIDSQRRQVVNCTSGCGITGTLPSYIVDKTTATPAPVYVQGDGDTNSRSALGVNSRNVMFNYGGNGWDRVAECGWSSSHQTGAVCVAGYTLEWDIAIGAASAGQTWTQNVPDGIGGHQDAGQKLNLCMSASAATTFTVQESPDGGTHYYDATIANTNTDAKFTTTGAGSICEMLAAPIIKISVSTSAAVTVAIQLEATL